MKHFAGSYLHSFYELNCCAAEINQQHGHRTMLSLILNQVSGFIQVFYIIDTL